MRDVNKTTERVWIYCPGHENVRGNERADSLASHPPIAETMTMGRIDIPPAIRDNLITSDMAIEETARLRLLDGAGVWGGGNCL